MESTVKPISFEPSRAASLRGDPLLHVPGDVLEHDNGVVHHKPRGDRQRHEGEVVQVVAADVHDAECADKGDRDGHGRDDGGAHIPQEREDHQDHQAEGDQEVDLDVLEGAPDRGRPVLNNGEIDPAGQGCLKLGERGADAVDRPDDVRVRLAEYDDHDGRLPIDEPPGPQVLDGILHPAHIREPHRGAGPVARR